MIYTRLKTAYLHIFRIHTKNAALLVHFTFLKGEFIAHDSVIF